MPDLRMHEINLVVMSGRLSRDPKTGHTGEGTAWAGFAIAVGKHWTDREGTAHESVSFHECKAWRATAEQAGKLRKGDPIIVEGSIEQEEFEGRDGKTQSKTRIQVRRIQELAWPETAAPLPDDDIPF